MNGHILELQAELEEIKRRECELRRRIWEEKWADRSAAREELARQRTALGQNRAQQAEFENKKVNERREAIAALYNAGKRRKEIARELPDVPLRTVSADIVFMVSHGILERRSRTWTRTSGSLTNATTQELRDVAKFWRDGLTISELAERMHVPKKRAFSLITTARRHLGVKLVPMRKGVPKPETAKETKAPIRMLDIDRYFLRRVGGEFIFRDAAGREELWVEGEGGLIHRSNGKELVRLVFKTSLEAVPRHA